MTRLARAAGCLLFAAMAVYPARADSADTNPNAMAAPATPDAPGHANGQSVSNQQVSAANDGTVEVHVNQADLVEVLRMLSVQTQRNIVASQAVKGTVTANLYGVTVRETLDAILKSNGCGYVEKGNFIYVYTERELLDITKLERHPVTRIFRLYYANAAEVSVLVKPLLSGDGEMSVSAPAKQGLDTAGTSAGGDDAAHDDLLVIKDSPDVLERVARAIQEIDHRPTQVLIEATILRARLTDSNSLGVNVAFSSGIDLGTLNAAGTGATPTEGGVRQAADGNILNNAAAPASLFNRGSTVGQIGGNGLQVGVLTNNVSVFIQALEGVTDTSILANPKVLVLDKQRGSILVGNEDGYRDTTTVAEGGTSTVGSVKFLETGTSLVFRPFVGNDGDIRMEIHPEDSSGSVDGTTGLPSKQTTQVTTNMMVKDGRTIAIGGLFREQTTINRSQVPLLGSLPVIGALFRQKTDQTERDEVIVLLTPHIIKDEAAYADASLLKMRDADRIRVGMRKELMWFGHERLADAWYQDAVDEMNKPAPRRGLALFSLDCALNANPQFLEATKLREQITGRMMSEADNSTIRGFITHDMLADSRLTAAGSDHQPLAVSVEPPPATQPAATEPASTATPPAAPRTFIAPQQRQAAPADVWTNLLNTGDAKADLPRVLTDLPPAGATTQPSTFEANAPTEDVVPDAGR